MVAKFSISISLLLTISDDSEDGAMLTRFMTLRILQLRIYILLWERQAVLQSFKQSSARY